MKKIGFLIVITLFVSMAVFAQNYTVQEITGRVERSLGNDRWDAVKVGDVLPADTIVRTVGLGVSFTVRSGDQVFRIGPATRPGKISELAASGTIRIQGNVSQVDTGAASRMGGSVSTAMPRQSDAAAIMDFEED